VINDPYENDVFGRQGIFFLCVGLSVWLLAAIWLPHWLCAIFSVVWVPFVGINVQTDGVDDPSRGMLIFWALVAATLMVAVILDGGYFFEDSHYKPDPKKPAAIGQRTIPTPTSEFGLLPPAI
jgi:hypothetical protein